MLIAAFLLLLLIIVAAWLGLRPHTGPERWVNIEHGATSQQVKDSLDSALGSVEGNRVWALWRISGGTPARARGRYLVTPGQISAITAWRLRGGRQTPIRVSWTDVRTLPQLAERIAAKFQFSADDFLSATDSILSSNGWTQPEYPAAFIPDSYDFYATASAATVVNKLLAYHDKFWNDERTAKANALGLTPRQVATLASIVEEESSLADERPAIARLYLNRLERNMPLQADPTVKFATGRFDLRRITSAHLAVESPYNTYRRRGLPPGPIRIASQSGIKAVLDAPKHDFIYMCAKEDFSGRHNFSTSFSEHQRNAARYHEELNRRNINE